MYNNNYNNNGYNQQNYGQPQQQQQEQFWPKVSGFKIGPTKSGKGNVITFTINAAPNARAKQAAMLFNDFMQALQAAFQASGGNGVRFVIPFTQGTGPRGPFQSGSIQVFPNNPQQHQGFNGGGGGRRQYPPQQQQQGYGYQQPPQPQYGHSGGYTNPPQQQQPAQQPVAPPQQQAPAPQAPAQAPAPQQAPQGYGVGEPIPF